MVYVKHVKKGLVVDNDSDDDGVCDSDDAFPNDSLEWSDSDGDVRR